VPRADARSTLRPLKRAAIRNLPLRG
jgi:hypothetical protein